MNRWRRVLHWVMLPVSLLLVGLGRIYQLVLSPLKPPTCRFYPTCSEYFIQAVRILGPVHGTWKGICRVARCHPFCKGGFDPVIPLPDEERSCSREAKRHATPADSETPPA